MSATLIDEVDDGNEEFEFKAVEPPVEETPEPVKEDLPEKYRGKSIQDVIEMHKNAEKLAGKQSSEVGELRKIVDDFITSQSQSTQEQPDEVDFLDNPEEAVKRAIESHPTVKAAEEVVKKTQIDSATQQAQNQLLEAHPDTPEILANPKFAEWVTASPSRQAMLQKANANNDVESMSFILDSFKETPESTATQQIAQDQQNAKKAAQTGSVSSSAGTSKKTYRRADIIKLMQTDPQRYEELQPEIMAAYREKRVI